MKDHADEAVTVEEAVALLINLDYVPAGLSPADMTSAFLEEAEVEHDNASPGRTADADLRALRLRVEVCRARHALTVALNDCLTAEIRKRPGWTLASNGAHSPLQRVALDKLIEWANDRFGLGTSRQVSRATASAPAPDFNWPDVEVKIHANYRLVWRAKAGKWSRPSFQKLGLMGTRKQGPNKLGLLLLGLAMGRKFPSGKAPTAADKTAVSKLRAALKELTGLSEDPFHSINEGDGWKPKFKLVDDRRNADERAKSKAVQVPFEEQRDSPAFEHEDDEAQRYIDSQK